jgi:hypothetical protein
MQKFSYQARNGGLGNSKREVITASVIFYLKSGDYIRILREREGEREAER